MVLTTAKQDATCGQGNGKASVTVTGGTVPYSYIWNDAASSTNDTLYDASWGTYTVTVTDGNSCQANASVTITDSTISISILGSVTNTGCSATCNGMIATTVSGGVTPYTYLWNDPTSQNTATATGLCGGTTYSVTVTDGSGCSAVKSYSVGPTALNSTISKINISCFGSCNGSATASVSGGTPPFSHSWNDASTQTTTTATGLCGGTYMVTVTDNNSCTISNSVTITETVTGITAGTYTVTVTDANSCTKTASATINTIAGIVIDSIAKTVATCGLCNGSAMVYPSGGTSPYTYNWSNGDAGQTADSICAGAYSVTITELL